MTAVKYLKQVSGELLEEVTVETSAGAGDASKIPNLNSSGVLDLTITNGKNSSAGSGDAGKLVALDSSGKIDTTMMPVGVGADTASITASEALSAGDYVNVYNNSGTPNCRKADASNGREAHGFVLSSVSSSASATVYFAGRNTGVTSRTPGAHQYLSTSGAGSETADTTSGHISQKIGEAVTSTSVEFRPRQPITLA